jgi:two-component system chemotaxis response regulator CheB
MTPGASHTVRAVAIGTSAGGIDALFALLGELPADYPLPVIVVLHLAAGRDSQLAELFGRRLALPVREAQPHAPIEPGTVYFAPPGYHLLANSDLTFSLSCDAPVLYSRPSIDVLFESCADVFGPDLAAMVLTGANADGAKGLLRVREAGGLALVQDPVEAPYPVMPQAAIDRAAPVEVLPLAGLRAILLQLGERT